jgi:hypothetical protein
MPRINWERDDDQPSRSYTCGYCGRQLASAKGYQGSTAGQPKSYIYICHFCNKPTFFDSAGAQTPAPSLGEQVEDIGDPSVADLYAEARKATTAGAYTSAVLACRKLLMHVAVAKGAPAGKNFVTYVEYLSAQNYVPPDAKPWVDHIRQKGNEANHEINIMQEQDAAELLDFSGMLLKLVYEFPAIMQRKYPAKPTP